MGFLALLIPIVCCVLIPAAIAAVAFLGLGKKNKPASNFRDNEVAPGKLPIFNAAETQ